MKNSKSSMRKQILESRDNLMPDQITQKSEQVQKKLFRLKEFLHASSVMFYVSFRSEVRTSNMIEEALLLDKNVFVPAVNQERKGLEAFAISSMDELARGAYGILEPIQKDEPANLNKIELIIVPGCVFDLEGFRIGYGAGYYDKLLKNVSAVSVALAFDFQIVFKIPCAEAHDMQVHKIVTEARVIDCRKSYPG